nr:MAG TPA: hypothetical protein [Caudoviricetes sp.]
MPCQQSIEITMFFESGVLNSLFWIPNFFLMFFTV